jgi:hypothetical protein
MTEFLSRFDGGELIAILSIVCGALFLIVALVADFWHKIRKAEVAAKLKQDMLDRGMSAEEIKIVLEAGTKSFPSRS